MKLSPTLIVIFLLFIGAFLSTLASFVFGNPLLTLFLGALVIYPVFLKQVIDQNYHQALVLVLLWAIFQSLAVIIISIQSPERGATVILNGVNCTNDMIHWIKTGEGAEGSFRLFFPIHLKYYSAFSLLSFLTVGFASLLLGTYLLRAC